MSLVFALADKSGVGADLSDFPDDFGVDFVLARLGVVGSDLMSASLALRLRVVFAAGESARSLFTDFAGLLAAVASVPLLETDLVALMVAVAKNKLIVGGLESWAMARIARRDKGNGIVVIMLGGRREGKVPVARFR